MQPFPLLTILASGRVGAAYYSRREDDAGFRSAGGRLVLPSSNTTKFRGPAEEFDVINDAVLPFSLIVEVAKEFLHSQGLPSTIEWFEL